ncbi:unnamed protein product [Larinioides sclopetarius]|uniref:Uncharacterized protein n=1 Tax=Larinioides sclopetarius TaxID=280406 RepID=A0AAV2B7P0_9ARAC
MLRYPFIPFSNLTTHTPRPHRGGVPPLRLFSHCPLAFSLPRTRTSSEDFSRSDGPRKIRVRTLLGRRSPGKTPLTLSFDLRKVFISPNCSSCLTLL